MKRINIIVPTFKRPEYLNRTLASLVNQKTSVAYEILVVDDDGTDPRTRNVVAFWESRAPVKYLTPGKDSRLHGRTRIRNFGIRHADAEILIFLDDDMLVTPDFVEEHSRSHETSLENQVVIGYRNHLRVAPNFLEHINPANLAGETVRFSELPSVKDEREDIYQLCQGNLNGLVAPWTILYSNNFSLRCSLLQKVGGNFNESFQGSWGGEDVELGYRLHKAGASFMLNRKAVGYHQWHYANWRRNMHSLHANLRRFFLLYPSVETELYVNYPETGLPTYFKDLRNYGSAKITDTAGVCDRPEVLRALQEKLASRPKALLIGAGNGKHLLKTASFDSWTDPRATVIRQLQREGASKFKALVGCHLPYVDKMFDVVVITDFVKVLSSYHRSMVIQEACRLAKKEVLIAVDSKELEKSKANNGTDSLTQLFGKWCGRGSLAEKITVKTIKNSIIASISRSRIEVAKEIRAIPSRLALILPADSQDSHTEQALELALALAKRGCDVAIQLEDHRRQCIVYADTIGGMNRFNKEEQELLRNALTKDLRGRNHLYPRLSLTGNYHFHGKRVDWIIENRIGLLSSPYVQVLNEESDTLWIPSGKVARLFAQSGVHSSKIKEVQVALPDHMVNGFVPDRSLRKFRFLAIGTVEKVDGLDLAIEAFCSVAPALPHSELVVRVFPIESREVMANDPRQNLTVKLSHRKHLEDVVAIHQYRLRKWKSLVRSRGLADRVSFENVNHQLRRWPDHLQDAHCLIQSQRVDINGHWVLRAMSKGIPVISAGRYLPNGLKGRWMNYFVQNKEISAADREWASNVVYTRWVEPQADSLARHLTHVYRNRKEAWRRADLAQEYVKKRLIWSQVVQEYVDDLKRISNSTSNGIAPNGSRTLFDDLKEHSLINLEEEPFERR